MQLTIIANAVVSVLLYTTRVCCIYADALVWLSCIVFVKNTKFSSNFLKSQLFCSQSLAHTVEPR